VAETKSDIQQMLDSHEGSPDPGHRANPFGESEGGFDLEKVEREQQAAANPEPTPPAEEPEWEPQDGDDIVEVLEGRVDQQGYGVEDEYPPEVLDAAAIQMQEQGWSPEEIAAAFEEAGFLVDDEPGTPAQEAEFANEEVEAREQALEELKQRHPALRDERVHQAILPELQELAELYGTDYIRNPKVIEEVYLRVDPDGEMAGQLEDEKTVDEIFNAKAGSFTTPFT
jgi:hypothetical protein